MHKFYIGQIVKHHNEKWQIIRPYDATGRGCWWVRNLRNGDEGWNTEDTFEVIASSVEDGGVNYA